MAHHVLLLLPAGGLRGHCWSKLVRCAVMFWRLLSADRKWERHVCRLEILYGAVRWRPIRYTMGLSQSRWYNDLWGSNRLWIWLKFQCSCPYLWKCAGLRKKQGCHFLCWLGVLIWGWILRQCKQYCDLFSSILTILQSLKILQQPWKSDEPSLFKISNTTFR